jgi:hypothetical protein
MTNNQVYNNQIITNNQKPINQTGLGIGNWNLGFIWSLGFGYWLLFFMILCLFASPAAQAAVGSNYIEQNGITWTFDKNISKDGSNNTYKYGTFINGDYWVVGPVNIVSINPPCQTGPWGGADGAYDSPTTQRTINGSMINPMGGPYQGYDSNRAPRGGSNIYQLGLNKALEMPLDVPVNSSFVSTISALPPTHETDLTDAAVLTVLAESPPADAFRPAYCGTDKTIKFTKLDLDYTKLKKLTPVANMPTWTFMESEFERPIIDHALVGGGQHVRPKNNFPGDIAYAAYSLGRYNPTAALMLNLDYSDSVKEKLLIRYVQEGIDLFGVVKTGGYWLTEGGHGVGRKIPILFAGYVLDDADMLNIGQKSGYYLYGTVDEKGYPNPYGPGVLPPDYIQFADDGSTHYVSQLDVDITNSSGWDPPNRDKDIPGQAEPYSHEDIGLPEWGNRHAHAPQGNNKLWDSPYRSLASAPLPGTALTMHIMGLKDEWNNPALFDYTDRYMTIIEDETLLRTSLGLTIEEWNGPHGDGRTEGRYQMDVWRNTPNGPGTFIRNMWQAYRANYGPLWPDKYGDVSGDSALSAYDAALCARIAVGLDAYPTGDNLTKADVSGGGGVTAYDAALIAQRAVGLISKFPVE